LTLQFMPPSSAFYFSYINITLCRVFYASHVYDSVSLADVLICGNNTATAGFLNSFALTTFPSKVNNCKCKEIPFAFRPNIFSATAVMTVVLPQKYTVSLVVRSCQTPTKGQDCATGLRRHFRHGRPGSFAFLKTVFWNAPQKVCSSTVEAM